MERLVLMLFSEEMRNTIYQGFLDKSEISYVYILGQCGTPCKLLL